ncbi:MAG TPA: AI-2E family transporter [Candidatus Acidoferrum sp.]
MSVPPSSPQTESQPRPMVRIVGLLWVVVIAIVVAFAYFASSLCITFLLAGFLALLLDPIPTFLERFRIPRVVSTSFLIITAGLGIGVAIHASYGRVGQLIEELPDYADRIHDAFEPLNQRIEKVQKSAGSITAATPAPVSKRSPPVVRVADQAAWPSYLIRGVGTVWGALIVGGIVPFLMFFMLVRKSHLYGWLENAFGETVDVAQFTALLTKMVRGFVFGSLIIGAAMAAVMVGVLYALKIQGAVPLGIASGFLNLIPFLGAILAAALPVFASLLQFDSPAPFIIIVVVAMTLHIVSANLLAPRFIGSRVNIGPVAATMGMLFWGWLWGIMGILLAVPLTAFVKLVADCHPSLIHISNLLAEKPRGVPQWAQERVARAVPFFVKYLGTEGKD